MEVPICNSRAWIILGLLLLFNFSTISGLKSQIEDAQSCNDLYICSPEESTFRTEHAYIYDFYINSTLSENSDDVDFLPSYIVVEDRRTPKVFSYNGSLVITPISRCEVEVAFNDESKVISDEKVSLKIALHNGNIQRYCTANNDSTPELNILKALVSSLDFKRSVNFELSDPLKENVVFESDSKGICMTKTVDCGNGKSLSYKSLEYCATSGDAVHRLVKNLKSKTNEFLTTISGITANACMVSPENIEIPSGISACIRSRENENFISSSHCFEVNGVDGASPSPSPSMLQYYGYVSLTLKEILPIPSTVINLKEAAFSKTSIQQDGSYLSGVSASTGSDSIWTSHLIKTAVEVFTNATKRENMKAYEIHSIFKNARESLHIPSEKDLTQFLQELADYPKAEKATTFFLTLVAEEASNENVLQFFLTILKKDFLKNRISPSNLESVLAKLLERIPQLKPSLFIAEFCKSIVEYLDNPNQTFSSTIKLTALKTFSERLDKFCERMEMITGELFCIKNSFIQKLINETLISKINNKDNYSGQMMALEAFTIINRYPEFKTENLYAREDMPNSIKLWAIHNFHRKNPCDKESKGFLRSLLQDKMAKANFRISAFLAMSQCFDEKDKDAIKSIFTTGSADQTELQEFIIGYKKNRAFYNLTQPTLEILKEPVHLSILKKRENNDTPRKTSRASNTFALFHIIPEKLEIDTNMLYFDQMAVLPEMITFSVDMNLNIPNSNGILRGFIFEVQIFNKDQRTSGEKRSAIDFITTVIMRKADKTIYMWDIPITYEKCFHLINLIKANIQELGNRPSLQWELIRNLIGAVVKEIHVDIFDLLSSVDSHVFVPTITGIPLQINLKQNGFKSLLLEKGDCSRILMNNGIENSEGENEKACGCKLKIKPELHYNDMLSIVMGFPKPRGRISELEYKGLLFNNNWTISYPIEVDAKPEVVQVTLPSLEWNVVSHHLHTFEIIGGNYTSPYFEPHDGIETKINITISKNEIHKGIKILSPDFELDLGFQTDPLYRIKGNLTYLNSYGDVQMLAAQVGVKNSEDLKRLEGKVVYGEDEYAMDVYYIRELAKDLTRTNHYRLFSCSNTHRTGLLCIWPFCLFCGAEYFVGATLTTPRFKNIKIFEGFVTQVYPNERFDLSFTTSGIHQLHNNRMTMSITHGNDTAIIHNPTLKGKIETELGSSFHGTSSSEKPVKNDDDALPEAQSKSSQITAYSLSWEILNERLGKADLSMVYVRAPDTSPNDQSMFASELNYPWITSPVENISVMAVLSILDSEELNITSDQKIDAQIRSSQLSLLSMDCSVRSQKKANEQELKSVVVLQPLHWLHGGVTIEHIDNAASRTLYGNQQTWNDFHIDQTYKVYLRGNPFTSLMGKLALKRENGITHEAGIEGFIGPHNGMDFQYHLIAGDDIAYELLTAITISGNTFSFLHHLQPVREVARIDGVEYNESEDNHKYKGTYKFGETSMKAVGVFVGRIGREILPFSRFDIQLHSEDGNDLGIRIFGTESTISDNINNMKIAISKDSTNIFEFTNEMNSADKIPIKASVSLKDFGDFKIFDTSQTGSKRRLQMRANWLSKKRVVQGQIAFPTSLKEPLYLDIDATITEEEESVTVFKLKSSSTLQFLEYMGLTTKNILQVKNDKWEFGFEGCHLKINKDGDSDTGICCKTEKTLNTTLLLFYMPPNLKPYSFHALVYECANDINNEDSNRKIFLRMERPDVTPLHLHFEANDLKNYTSYHSKDLIDYHYSQASNEKYIMRICHKDNFLYFFPTINLDFSVEGVWEDNNEYTALSSGSNEKAIVGKFFCRSAGIPLPLCNQINISYNLISIYYDNYSQPWVANLTVQNKLRDFNDELSVKMVATYDSIRPSRADAPEDFDNIIEDFLNTVRDDTDLLKHTYNYDYCLQRKPTADNGQAENYKNLGINGTYIFTKVYESRNFFEFSEQFTWNKIDGGGFHIWTRLLNHSTDLNLTSESATYSTQYVFLGEGEKSNVTWMELRTNLNSNGFGTLKNIILQPSTIITSDKGMIEIDFLVRSQFSPLKIFRILASHDQTNNENEEDDQSRSFQTLSKLSGLLNGREISGTNWMTADIGKLIGVGNSFFGNYKSEEGIGQYASVKTFALTPINICDKNEDNVIHLDISSSWTNADDDDVDIRISNDFILAKVNHGFPLIRFAYMENSTDLEIEKNSSIFLYQGVLKDEVGLRFPETVISDGLDDLNFAQGSLQSICQQIFDDYYNFTIDQGRNKDGGLEYNFEVRSSRVIQNNIVNEKTSTKLIGFEDKLFHCQSTFDMLDSVANNSEYEIDTSNYCNLPLLPVKPFLVL